MATNHSRSRGSFSAPRHGRYRAVAALFLLLLPLTGEAGIEGSARGEAPAARIVSLVPAVTETLFALDLGPRVVGVSIACDYPEQARRLPKVGSFVEPVAEAILSLTPDLVLTSPTPGNQPAVRALERAGIRIAVVRSEGGIAEAQAAIAGVASAAGANEAGARLIEALQHEISQLAARTRNLERPPVAIVVGREPLVLAGTESYLGELLEIAGGRNVAAGLTGRWPRVGYEFLIEAGPQILIDLTLAMGGPDDGSTAEVANAAWSKYGTIPAVKNGRIHPGARVGGSAADASMLLRPGPRLGRSAALLASWIHPELAEPDGGSR